MILRARVVVPVVRPPLSDGAVIISGNRIKAVGRWRDLRRGSGSKIDLGEVVLMPGLINAHCHLDYTHMAGQFATPKAFIDWLKLIVTTKAGWTPSEYNASWQNGAEMLLRSGSTTVADIEAVPLLLPEVWDATPLRVVSLLEMIGITGRRPPEVLLEEILDRAPSLHHHRASIGLSPHAPYSTVSRLLQLSAEAAQKRGWLVCTHVAESEAEFNMFTYGKGDMFEWLRRSGREMADCGDGSPVQHLDRTGLLRQNLIAVHANYLARGDAALLARRGVSVAHCPRSHAFFRHSPFPFQRLNRAGVNVCLGTDSLSTVVKPRHQTIELDMFAEMRQFASQHHEVSPKRILRMATVNGARALGRQGKIGQLSRGALADLIALPVAARIGRTLESILQHQGPVTASMIDGQWAISPR